MKEIIIVGAGIGGLATALGLARLGHKVTVMDKKAELTETGAGIQLGPNAFHALDYLGIGEKIRATGIDIDELIMSDGVTGERISAIPLGEPFEQYFGNPYLVIHRCDLHGILLEQCSKYQNIQCFNNQKVIAYRNIESRVEIETEVGDVFSADAVIGADGLHSNMRRLMLGETPLNKSGHVAYRAVIPAKDMPQGIRWNAGAIWLGPNSHIVHYPLENRESYNIVAVFVTDQDSAGQTGAGDRAELQRKMAHFSELPRSLLDIPNQWMRSVLADRDPVDNWTDGHVTLLGDAAHPTYQYFAQGACMALEDAVNLSVNLDKSQGDFKTAFSHYQEQRSVRAYRVVLSSRLLGQFYHASGVERKIRNAVMSNKTVADHYHSLQWLYGSNGLGEKIIPEKSPQPR